MNQKNIDFVQAENMYEHILKLIHMQNSVIFLYTN